jgi:hypothetical protein
MSGKTALPGEQGKGGQMRKHTYYCVLTIFRNDGSLPQFELNEKRRCEEHPVKTVMQNSKTRLVRVWYSSRKIAERAMERVASNYPGAETWCGL